jgi:hypothetical protein
MTDLAMCARCRQNMTAKRVDGAPICQPCFLADAAANKGIAMDYSALAGPATGPSGTTRPARKRRAAPRQRRPDLTRADG